MCTAVPSTDYFERRLRNTAVGNQSPALFRIQTVPKVYNNLRIIIMDINCSKHIGKFNFNTYLI